MKTETEYNDILSMVTHDLKSPLSATMFALELLDDELDKSERDECIKIAKRATMSALKLAEDILVMAKHEAGKEHFEKYNVENLNECLDIIKDTFKYQMKIKNINFNTDIDKDLPNVFWDMDKIKYHVINNIISNAIKFTPENGQIDMIVKSKDENIIIKILDNGVGIDKEKRDDIFTKYSTCNDKKIFKGTGLGLYNAHCFVTMHDGKIDVIDGVDGKGIGFEITIPLKS
jgi:signal transduction histidine kinase